MPRALTAIPFWWPHWDGQPHHNPKWIILQKWNRDFHSIRITQTDTFVLKSEMSPTFQIHCFNYSDMSSWKNCKFSRKKINVFLWIPCWMYLCCLHSTSLHSWQFCWVLMAWDRNKWRVCKNKWQQSSKTNPLAMQSINSISQILSPLQSVIDLMYWNAQHCPCWHLQKRDIK